MIIVGLDQSMTKAGLATSDTTEQIVPPIGVIGIQRVDWWYDWTRSLIGDLFVIEGYAFNRTNKAHEIGEVGGAVKLALRRTGRTVVLVPPARLKMFVTANGNANKQEMGAWTSKRADVIFKTDDQVDAYGLRQLGLARYDPDSCTMLPTNEKHRKVLTDINWPIML